MEYCTNKANLCKLAMTQLPLVMHMVAIELQLIFKSNSLLHAEQSVTLAHTNMSASLVIWALHKGKKTFFYKGLLQTKASITKLSLNYIRMKCQNSFKVHPTRKFHYYYLQAGYLLMFPFLSPSEIGFEPGMEAAA